MKTVTIGIMCDAFSITIDDCTYYISQEDDPSIELSRLFNEMGYHVEVSEDY